MMSLFLLEVVIYAIVILVFMSLKIRSLQMFWILWISLQVLSTYLAILSPTYVLRTLTIMDFIIINIIKRREDILRECVKQNFINKLFIEQDNPWGSSFLWIFDSSQAIKPTGQLTIRPVILEEQSAELFNDEMKRLLTFRPIYLDSVVLYAPLARAGFFYVPWRACVQCSRCTRRFSMLEVYQNKENWHDRRCPFHRSNTSRVVQQAVTPTQPGEVEEEIALGNGLNMIGTRLHNQNGSSIPDAQLNSSYREETSSIAGNATDQQTAVTPDLARQPTITTPAYPGYTLLQKRLDTFTTWQYSHICTPKYLAINGFFYAGYADCVRCFQCGLGLKNWKPGDDVIEEHKRHRPSCPRAKIKNGPSSRQPGRMINEGLTSSQPVDITYTVRARNSRNETATILLRPEVDGSLEQRQQTTTEMFVNGALSQEATELPPQHTPGQPTFDDNKPVHSEEERNHPKSLPVSLLERENKILKLQMTCKICLNAPIKELFLPCGDLCVCSDCSQQLTHCPDCSKLILATFTIRF